MVKQITNLFLRLKHKIIAKIITRFPRLSQKMIESFKPVESDHIPWTPFSKSLNSCKLALVTTAGVHHKSQQPFNMTDKNGDPTFREIDMNKPISDLMITHDYYDHSDADVDINIVFPLERVKEFFNEGIIGNLSQFHYSFMGHIDGSYIKLLVNDYAVQVAEKLKKDGVDVVLLTPG